MPAPNLAFLTMAVGRRVRARVDAALAAYELTYRHLSALGHLAGTPDLSYTELARRAGVTTQSMQATLAQLQQRGAVEQRNLPMRGRRAELRVTETGADLLRAGTTAIADIEQELSQGLSTDQRDLLNAALLALLARLLADPREP